MNTKQIDRGIIAVLALHLLYTNTLLLASVNPTMTGYLFSFIILFASSYSSLTAIILDRIPNWWLFIVAAILDGLGVLFEYGNYNAEIISIYFSVYTALIVIAIGFLKLENKAKDTTKAELENKTKNLSELEGNYKRLKKISIDTESKFNEISTKSKKLEEANNNYILEMENFKELEKTNKRLEEKNVKLNKQGNQNIEQINKLQEDLLVKDNNLSETSNNLIKANNNLTELKETAHVVFEKFEVIGKLKQGYKNENNRVLFEKCNKFYN